ncbi:MAG: threonine synthase [Deltaproteobacteria bacterium]|nr:threonine synthase [Deltaproteobacteria bacterium]
MRAQEILAATAIDVRPRHEPRMVYRCVACGEEHELERLLYVCPRCRSLLRVADRNFDALRERTGEQWRTVFDLRRCLQEEGMRGIFLFHELVLPWVPLEDVIYLGEGHTPLVRGNAEMAAWLGAPCFVKNDGQNPSASFKDRGMASAISFLNHYIRRYRPDSVLGICASTGDTSAAAALYLSYLPAGVVTSAVLLPAGRVTPQQLSQPLGSGATVIEVPGVFDDCMKLVESLSETYDVFLLNSKNPVRICGQKSFAFEVAQQLGWRTDRLTVVVPIGNAGNVTALMEGFLDLRSLGIIDALPRILGVQSEHANPVSLWHDSGEYRPTGVRPSVAQAAMIGNPVSFPKVKGLVEEHFRERFDCISVTEQEIMDSMLVANRHGHVVCTQGGEALAGLRRALGEGRVDKGGTFVCDSTSHQLKFAGFQEAYFADTLGPEFEVRPRAELQNRPVSLPATVEAIAERLGLKRR